MMSTSRYLACALLLTFGSVGIVRADECSLKGLSWITGSWHDVNDPQGSQERWVAAPRNVLMGSAWEFPLGKSGFAEIMTIKQDDKRVSMVLRHFDGGLSHAWEDRDTPMVFAASSCASDSVIFDGQGDRSGERLTYQRNGDKLLILGDFIHQGKTQHVEWSMVRAGD